MPLHVGSLRLLLTMSTPDVLETCPEMLRRLCQRLHHEITHLPRRGLRHAVCRQIPERLRASGTTVPGTECCHDVEWSATGQIALEVLEVRRDGVQDSGI